MPAVPRVDRLKTLYSSAKALNDGYKVYGVPKVSRIMSYSSEWIDCRPP